MNNIFQELEMMSLGESSIQETRKELNEIVTIMTSLEMQEDYISIFCNQVRDGIDVETMKKLKTFFIPDDLPVSVLPEKLRHDSLGFCRDSHFVMQGRFVAPVMDVKGDVMGFVGYDKFEQPKYLDSINYGYKAKNKTFYGMENLPKYYKDNYIFFVEGPGCRWYLESKSINCGALLGSYLSEYVAEIGKRFGRNCIVIPDSDQAGDKLKYMVRNRMPEARIYQSKVAKDIDDSRKLYSDIDEDLLNILKNPFHRSKYFLKS